MKTNIGLVEYAKKALSEKWGYVWGTFGLVLTQLLFQQKLKQYPKEVGQYEAFIKVNWINRKTTDCVGLIKSYLWEQNGKVLYTANTDVSANGMYEKAREKGLINTIPEIPGICVYKQGHIGVYIGNGQVIEAKGTKAGVIQSPLKGVGSAGWTHWLKCPYIEYVAEKKGLTLEDAIEVLQRNGIINSSEYWRENALISETVKGEYAAALILKMAEKLRG